MILGLVVAGVAAIVVVVLVVVILVILCGMRSHCCRKTAPLDNSSVKHAAIQSLMNPNYDGEKERAVDCLLVSRGLRNHITGVRGLLII